MKKWVLLAALALVGVLGWYFGVTRKAPKQELPKDQPVAVSRYSVAFNNSVDTFLASYYALSEALVKWDSSAAVTHAQRLSQNLDAVKWTELKQDTVVYETATTYVDGFKSTLPELAGNAGLETKRRSFNTFSQNLYDLLRTVKYDGAKLYLQQCPMAFNDTEEGLWLSRDKQIRNPYLGLHHPKYKAGMLACGETKDTLSFQGAN